MHEAHTYVSQCSKGCRNLTRNTRLAFRPRRASPFSQELLGDERSREQNYLDILRKDLRPTEIKSPASIPLPSWPPPHWSTRTQENDNWSQGICKGVCMCDPD